MRLRSDLALRVTAPEHVTNRAKSRPTNSVRSVRSRDEAMLWIRCAIVLALLWALIVAVGVERAEMNRRHRSDLAQSTAKGFSEYVGLNMLMADHVLLHARELYARAGTIPPLANLTADLGPTSQFLLQVAAADVDGRVIASSLPLKPGLSIADRPHFIEFLNNPRDRLHVSVPVVGRVSKKMSLQLVRPLLGSGGEFRGVIVASIDPEKLQEYFGALAAFNDEGTVLIAGRTDGIVRTRLSRGGITWGESLRGDSSWDKLSQSHAGKFEVDRSNPSGLLQGIVGFHQVGSYPLVIGVTAKITHWPASEMALSVAIGIAFSVIQILYTRSRTRRIREQELLIEQLTQGREREVEASRMKSRFIASISHELRTPLSAILGFSELVRDIPNHPDNARRADLIHSSGQHLHTLLNTLLDLAKIEAGRMEVDRAEVDLGKTVRTLADVHRVSANKKDLSMTFESGLSVSQTALADTDSTKFVQVLNNVLNNAVKFTNKGGVRVSVFVKEKVFVVQVEDSGCGIPVDRLSFIFDRFSTASTMGSAKESGTGLGLSLSRELIRLLGGSIEISSRPGQGTQVTVCLPDVRVVKVQR